MPDANEGADEIPDLFLVGEIDLRRCAVVAAKQDAQEAALAEMGAPVVRRADQEDALVLAGKADPRHPLAVGDEADAGNGRGGQDADAIGLVVKRDVARNDGEIEGQAGFADALRWRGRTGP